jgi:GNAT superfamily N-acetyltransferase
MFTVRQAESGDVDPAVSVLADAFAQDPLMLYLFRDNPRGIRHGVAQFFTILLQARLALGMPAHVLMRDDQVRGGAMGYDTTRPVWPPALTEEWRAFEVGVPGLDERLAAYEKICEAHQPSEDHYYLGVIGVHPAVQGKGGGKILLEAFCGLSHGDANSGGVYLDTSNRDSLEFYRRNGFQVLGEGALDGAPLWCVYRRT